MGGGVRQSTGAWQILLCVKQTHYVNAYHICVIWATPCLTEALTAYLHIATLKKQGGLGGGGLTHVIHVWNALT